MAYFYVTFTGSFDRFQYLNFAASFLKNENFNKKKLEGGFLVVSTTIENITFPYTSPQSKANFEADRIRYLKEFCH